MRPLLSPARRTEGCIIAKCAGLSIGWDSLAAFGRKVALRAHEMPMDRLYGVESAVVAEKFRSALSHQFLVDFVLSGTYVLFIGHTTIISPWLKTGCSNQRRKSVKERNQTD